MSRASSGFLRYIPPDPEDSHGVGIGLGVPTSGDPREAILWSASGEWGREGEVSRGRISFCAVRLTIVGVVRIWDNGLGYCRLPGYQVVRGELSGVVGLFEWVISVGVRGRVVAEG